MDRWIGKVAVVTGASSGIGAVTAVKLAEKGLIVVGIARRSENIEKLGKQLVSSHAKGKLLAYKADMGDEKQIVQAFDWIENNVGVVHILINNAGVASPSTLHDGKTDVWKNIINVNLLGTAIATREVLKEMRKRDIDGHIIHINSVAGHKIAPLPELGMYTASKFGLTVMTDILRAELVDLKSRTKITSISPGAVKTPMISDPNSNPILAKKMSGQPVLQPEDIADAILYVLGTPPHVQIHELTIKPVGEGF